MTLGERMKKLMSDQNISQKDLAIRLNVQEATVSRYVNNTREPNAENLANIATALNTTVDCLLGKSSDTVYKCAFEELKSLVARNATSLTQEEKCEIINVLLNGIGVNK